MNCDACGKSMVDEDGHEFIGMTLEIKTSLMESEFKQFAVKQIEPYQIDRKYGICWACWLRSLGIKP